ncbi:hypothetical protein D1AOALGA4SA_3971 [Olavius algarvensis Delta 1 endosymbiont]|nr:hypothetical protein D1AOALGA4SA_3971 [Olavius algarvensis Delta 1 endosymbiont]
MKKTAGVYTNDKNLPRQDLVISGPVEKFVTIRPRHVSLRGIAGDPIKGLVKIIPEKKYPFKILDVRAKNGKNINFQLDEVKSSNGPAYELKVENLRENTGRFYDTIILQTDSTVRPELNVRVYGNLRTRKSE